MLLAFFYPSPRRRTCTTLDPGRDAGSEPDTIATVPLLRAMALELPTILPRPSPQPHRACDFQASRAWPTFCYRSFQLPPQLYLQITSK